MPVTVLNPPPDPPNRHTATMREWKAFENPEETMREMETRKGHRIIRAQPYHDEANTATTANTTGNKKVRCCGCGACVLQ